MKYSIVLTETAQADLSAIFRYIAVDLQSVQNASDEEKYHSSRLPQPLQRWSADHHTDKTRLPCIFGSWLVPLRTASSVHSDR